MQHVEKHFTGDETVRDVVISKADGLTVPFALAPQTHVYLHVEEERHLDAPAPGVSFHE